METWSIITPPGAVAVRRQVLPMVEAHRRSHRSIDSQWSFPQTPNTVGVDLLRSWHNPHIGSLTWGIKAFSGKNQLQFPETAPIHLAKIAIGTIERWQNGNTRLGLTSNISHLLVFDGDLIRPAEEKRKKERKKESSWRTWQLSPVFLPGKPHRQRSLASWTLWSHRRVGHNLVTKQQKLDGDFKRLAEK